MSAIGSIRQQPKRADQNELAHRAGAFDELGGLRLVASSTAMSSHGQDTGPTAG